MGGAARLWGSVVLLHGLSAWQPFPQYPLNMPVNPGIAVEFSEWVPVWSVPGEAGASHGSVSDHRVRIDVPGRAADYLWYARIPFRGFRPGSNG